MTRFNNIIQQSVTVPPVCRFHTIYAIFWIPMKHPIFLADTEPHKSSVILCSFHVLAGLPIMQHSGRILHMWEVNHDIAGALFNFWGALIFFVPPADFGVSAKNTKTLQRRDSFIGTPYWWGVGVFFRDLLLFLHNMLIIPWKMPFTVSLLNGFLPGWLQRWWCAKHLKTARMTPRLTSGPLGSP